MEPVKVLVWRIGGEEKNDDWALTEEAAMIMAVGVANLLYQTQCPRPYCLMPNWPKEKQQTLGVALLWKAWKMIQLEEPQP